MRDMSERDMTEEGPPERGVQPPGFPTDEVVWKDPAEPVFRYDVLWPDVPGRRIPITRVARVEIDKHHIHLLGRKDQDGLRDLLGLFPAGTPMVRMEG